MSRDSAGGGCCSLSVFGAHSITIAFRSATRERGCYHHRQFAVGAGGQRQCHLYADIDSTFFAHSVGSGGVGGALSAAVYNRDCGYDARVRSIRDMGTESGWLR
jgi:hypothetical protein